MSFLPNPIACDVCGVIKGQANHWFYSVIPEKTPGFIIYPWDSIAENRSRTDIAHLCGQVCSVKKFSEWMDQQTGLAQGHEAVYTPAKE